MQYAFGGSNNMIRAFDIALIVLSLLSFILHTIGAISMLVLLRNEARKKSQTMLIINLAILESVKNLLNSGLLFLPLLHSGVEPSYYLQRLQHHMAIISESTITLIYYSAMVYITLDRLLAITMGIRYQLYWRFKRVMILLITTWLLSIMVGIIAACLYEFYNIYYYPYNKYVYLILDVFFITLALVTYTVIFCKYHTSLSNKMVERQQGGRRASLVMTFLNSTFYVPIALVTLFLVLIVTPDLANVILIVTENPPSMQFVHICMVLNVTSDIADACLYVFLKKAARTWICAFFCRKKRLERDSTRDRMSLVRNNLDKGKCGESIQGIRATVSV